MRPWCCTVVFYQPDIYVIAALTYPSRIVFQDEEDAAFRGRSLQLSWAAPAIDVEYGDFFGDGGDGITAYLVEWSSSTFDDYELSTSTVYVSCDGNGGTVNGTFRLMLNTSDSELAAVKVRAILYFSAAFRDDRIAHLLLSNNRDLITF